MQWPEKPTCHGDTSHGGTFTLPGAEWRLPDPLHVSPCDNCGYESRGPYGYPFTTCSYCGSISMEDFANWCKNAAVTLGGTDWKYRYPHKFYIEGIPNPYMGQVVSSSSMLAPFDHEPSQAEIDEQAKRLSFGEVVSKVLPPGPRGSAAHRWEDSMWRVCMHGLNPAPATVFAKLYTDHLQDEGYDDEARDLILKLVSERSGIEFSVDDAGKIMYRAPYFGYQKS